MRVDRVVANASPLICLFRAGLEGILGQLWTTVAVPDAVWREVVEGPKEDSAAVGLPRAQWVWRAAVATPHPLVASWDLGPGESEVLTLAIENPGYRAIVDDAEARRCCRALGIATLGTGAVLVLAKRRGLIASLSGALATLRASGLWISDSVVAQLKAQAGE